MFKREKYQDIILPLTVLRRLDCVLAPTKEKVLGKQAAKVEWNMPEADALDLLSLCSYVHSEIENIGGAENR